MTLNPLQQAILDGRTEDVRRIASSRPELLVQLTEVGTPALALAVARGVPIGSAIALLRAGAPGAEAPHDWAELLRDYMRELSESCSCAGWLVELEFLLWYRVTTTAALPAHRDGMGGVTSLSDGCLGDLEFLARRAGGWWAWSDAEGPKFVTMETWLLRYDAWVADHADELH